MLGTPALSAHKEIIYDPTGAPRLLISRTICLAAVLVAKIIGADFQSIMFKNYVKHVVQKNRLLFNLLKKDE